MEAELYTIFQICFLFSILLLYYTFLSMLILCSGSRAMPNGANRFQLNPADKTAFERYACPMMIS